MPSQRKFSTSNAPTPPQRSSYVPYAFRNICTQSDSVHLFAGRLEPDNALVIDMAAAFGWSGSPATYGAVGGAIAFIHGASAKSYQPRGLFTYYWVDDHINVAVDAGSNCADADVSLRNAMVTVLGAGAINEDKFTTWRTRQKVLGLIFDTVAGTVSMPQSKIDKAQSSVVAAYSSVSRARSDYRSLLSRLRHVVTCVQPAQPFLQRLRRQERCLHRWQRIPVLDDMKQDLVWWFHILRLPQLNGVPLAYFRPDPPPDVIVEMNASDSGLCVLTSASQKVLRYAFRPDEVELITTTKATPAVFQLP